MAEIIDDLGVDDAVAEVEFRNNRIETKVETKGVLAIGPKREFKTTPPKPFENVEITCKEIEYEGDIWHATKGVKFHTKEDLVMSGPVNDVITITGKGNYTGNDPVKAEYKKVKKP